jgi:nicotinate-nucleotide pyrophosphorylase (carboxylating)
MNNYGIDIACLDKFLNDTLKEDVGFGDVTSLSTIAPDKIAKGRFVAKHSGVFCGEDVLRRIFGHIFDDTNVELLVSDGDRIEKGTLLAKVVGNARSVLTGERTALNVIQHLSGVATATAEAVAKIEGTGARIADTRKTTPGMRFLEKYAVRVGGGSNHRFNLSDGILIKDNHICAAGGITNAIKMARHNATHLLKIEVEVESIDAMLEAIEAGADVVMLDNMDLSTTKEAVKAAAGRVLIEASGNMDERDIHAIAEAGVDIISMGALTHSVKAVDISLKFEII